MLNGQRNAIVVTDIDSGYDSAFISALVDCIRETYIPIICICEDKYNLSIRPLLNICVDIKMFRPNYADVSNFMRNIVMTEKIRICSSQLRELYEQSNGDIRYMLNSLQMNASLNNQKQVQCMNIFDTTGQLLSMDETFDRKNDIYHFHEDIHPLMIHENYVNNLFGIKVDMSKLENMSNSAEALSDSDLFLNNYEYSAVNVIRATIKCNKKTTIKFQQYLGKISIQNKNKKNKINYDEIQFNTLATTNKTKVSKSKVSKSKASL
jgi:replication factor C subunit 1